MDPMHCNGSMLLVDENDLSQTFRCFLGKGNTVIPAVESASRFFPSD